MITYLLGAGASYNSIPIVSELEERFNYHVEFLPLYFGTNVNLSAYIDALQRFIPYLHHYTSIDTYAKYLKLKGEHAEYEKLKNVLTMFFMLEQFVELCFDPVHHPEDKAAVEANPYLDQLGYSYKSKSFKKYRLDPRYNNFVVSLMNSTKWPSNVKILSWNYDFQLEMACNSIYPGLLNYYPNKKKHDETHLFHLNGIAGISKERELVLDTDNLRSFEDVISHWQDLTKGRGHNDFLRFAWESNLNWELIEDHLKQTEILVVIGYSFPFFNRDVDSIIFEYLYNEGKLRKIYFQDPQLDGQFLHEQFGLFKPSKSRDDLVMELSTTGLSKQIVIEHFNKHDRFFIPNEYQEPLE